MRSCTALNAAPAVLRREVHGVGHISRSPCHTCPACPNPAICSSGCASCTPADPHALPVQTRRLQEQACFQHISRSPCPACTNPAANCSGRAFSRKGQPTWTLRLLPHSTKSWTAVRSTGWSLVPRCSTSHTPSGLRREVALRRQVLQACSVRGVCAQSLERVQ